VTRAWLLVLAACPGPAPKPQIAFTDVAANAESDVERRQRLLAELTDDILSSYDRDDPPDVESSMFSRAVGPARIGVGPGDIYYSPSSDPSNNLLHAPSRWPLRLDRDLRSEVRSKHLDIHLSADKQVSAAWMSDELSWRITVCGHTGVIPLRITALFARDGDRWVEAFEHLSFAQVPVPQVDPSGAPLGKPIESAVASRRLNDELSEVLAPLLFHNTGRIAQIVALDPAHVAEADPTRPAPTFLLAPDPEGEWHGDQDVASAQLVDSKLIKSEDRRVGTIGATPDKATIAYWVGNFDADLPARPGTPPIPAGKVRLRGTFVFEKRAGRWLIVQGHMSEPVYDNALAGAVFGTVLASDLQREPLRVTCDR
jgi:hypothetical protein